MTAEVSPSQDNSGCAVLLHAGWWLDDPEEPFALLPWYCLCWFVFKQVHKTHIWKIDLWSFVEHNLKNACSSSVCVEWSYWTCIVVSPFYSEVLLGASKSHKWKTNKQLTSNEQVNFENDLPFLCSFSTHWTLVMKCITTASPFLCSSTDFFEALFCDTTHTHCLMVVAS